MPSLSAATWSGSDEQRYLPFDTVAVNRVLEMALGSAYKHFDSIKFCSWNGKPYKTDRENAY